MLSFDTKQVVTRTLCIEQKTVNCTVLYCII